MPLKFLVTSLVHYQKSTIIANSGKIQKQGPYTVLYKIRIVLKYKSASKPEKPSLIHTSQRKTMLLPRADNGIISLGGRPIKVRVT